MAVIIFAPEENVATLLKAYCRSLGYTQVQTFNRLGRAAKCIENEQKIEMVLSTSNPETDQLVYELTKREKSDPNLSFVPFIQILPYRSQRFFNPVEDQGFTLTRVDCYLVRPFSKVGFRNAVESAFENRVRQRDTILILGNQFQPSIAKTLWDHTDQRGYPWKNLLSASNETELRKRLSCNWEKIGAILIGPDGLFGGGTELLSKFRKKNPGGQTPFGGVRTGP